MNGEKVVSKLKFDNYVVNHVEYIENTKFYTADNEVNLKINLKKNMEFLDESSANVTLSIVIFENAVENNYPFEMKVTITGFFIVDSYCEEDKVLLEKNTIAILYPYLRALVSTFTSNCNVPPLILPTINVNKLVERSGK